MERSRENFQKNIGNLPREDDKVWLKIEKWANSYTFLVKSWEEEAEASYALSDVKVTPR